MGIIKKLDTYLKDKLHERLDQEQTLRYRDMERYSRHIEELYKEVRSFRHDYSNLLTSLRLGIEEEAMEALEAVGLKDRAKHLPNQLSGGEQQRVCIARALINHPALLLADEPTGNLDEKNEYVVMDIFEKLHNAGSTIIVVTHDPEVGDEAERMVTLEHGRIAGEEKKKRQRPVIKDGDDKFKGFV